MAGLTWTRSSRPDGGIILHGRDSESEWYTAKLFTGGEMSQSDAEKKVEAYKAEAERAWARWDMTGE